ncbi:Cytoplasmic tRNA 2-thiolation protein 2 [Aphelenchoides fujianensis]|nr:Cytoplasmic tRNA 2-thiolation protein 2 [Aphelenchoides fujianensis]
MRGPGVLASFLHEVINETNSKKHFKINPKLFLVDTSESPDQPADCPFEIAGHLRLADALNDALNDDAEVFRTKGIDKKEDAFEWLLRTASSRSMKAEFKRLAFDLLLWKLAEQTGVSIALTSETSDLIAQRTMDLMCFGRSQSVPVLCSTLDQRHPRVSVVRPLRNLTDAELKFVLRAEEAAVRFASHGDPTTERFVANAMESGFPSTISTVLSVVSKLDNAKLPAASPQSTGDAPAFCSFCLMPRSEEDTCELCTNLLQQVAADDRPLVHALLRFSPPT